MTLSFDKGLGRREREEVPNPGGFPSEKSDPGLHRENQPAPVDLIKGFRGEFLTV